MPSNEVVLVDSYISQQQAERQTPLPDDVAFEIFAASTVLLGQNLSDEEVSAGRTGGGKDGGIDGVFVFLDDQLLDEDSSVFAPDFTPTHVRKHAELTLWLVQAKRETSFSETTLDKVASAVGRLLDLSLTDEQLSVYYASDLIAKTRLFTNGWKALGTRSPRIVIRFDYVTKGSTGNVAPAVSAKARDLESTLQTLVPHANAEVRFIGASELWAWINATREYDLQLRFEDYITKGSSYSGLARLSDYFNFLTDSDGHLRGHLFDWNVRDYQGSVTVNRGIQETLETDIGDDFWWLNNGVTILCSNVTIGAEKTFALEGVQIVNGMQTSHSIYDAISRMGAAAEDARNRSILVRVFKTQDESTRDRIIRATNSQTKVPDASLHATEDIHRQIESYFLSKGWFYDRRKNYYKNIGKPTEKIVSIAALGQAVMAIGLGRPDDARARPSTLLNNVADYASIFSSKVPLQTYFWLATLQRRVDALLLSESVGADASQRTNLRFHVSLFLATRAYGAQIHSPQQLSDIAMTPLVVDEDLARGTLAKVLQIAGGEGDDYSLDRVAKSRTFASRVVQAASA